MNHLDQAKLMKALDGMNPDDRIPLLLLLCMLPPMPKKEKI